MNAIFARKVKTGVKKENEEPIVTDKATLRGKLRFICEGETFEAGKGDSWCIPGNAEHGVEVLADAVVLELFSPVREDYLPAD